MGTTVKRVIPFLMVLLLMLTPIGCGEKTDTTGSVTADDGREILITGLTNDEYKITVGELKKLPVVTEKAQATRSNGEVVKVKATGCLLEDLLQQQGKSTEDYNTIRFTALDGYSIAVPSDILKSRTIILAYQMDGKPLDDENRPVRVVIPGERAMYWVRMLEKVELEAGAEQTPIRKVVLLETAAKALPTEDIKDFDSTDKAIKTKDLIQNYAESDEVQNVFIQASDGLHKNETQFNFLNAYIKITGKEAPKFLAPHMPQGMHVRDLLCINYGATSFLFYSQAQKVLSLQTLEGISGISLSAVIKQTGLSQAEKYKFSRLDGSSMELAVNELGNALIYENSQGDLAFYSPGTAAAEGMDNLLAIECLE